MALLMGVVPTLFTKPMEPAVRRMVERVQASEPVRVENSPSQRSQVTGLKKTQQYDIVLASESVR
jgi:hypothetical protein